MKIKKKAINLKNSATGEWESVPALQGEKGPKGDTGDNKVGYATCSTAADVAEKILTIADTNWKLEVGSMITVEHEVSNTASNVTLNVNGTGAYPIMYNGSEYTSTSSTYCGHATRPITYLFNGTHWVWLSIGYYPTIPTNPSLGHGYGTCTTAEATLAKACTISSYTLTTGGSVSIKFTNAVPANSTLNIRTRGAKKIFYKGSAITDGVIKAGDTATFVYDGTQYQLISIDRDETFNGDYNSLTNKPTIPTKTSQLTNDSGYITSIPSEYVTDEELTAKGYVTEEYVQSQIAKIDDSIDIVDSVDEMTNTAKQYVHSGTNTWWKYKKETVPSGGVLPNVNNAINWSSTRVVLNKRINSSEVEVDAPGSAIFYFTFDDEMKQILNTIDPVWIRLKGCTIYHTTGNSTSTKVVVKGRMNASPYSQILIYEETEDGISDTPYASQTFNYSDNKTAPVQATKFGYMNITVNDDNTNSKVNQYATDGIDRGLALSLIVNFANTNPITEEDLKDVYITFNEPIVSYEETTAEYWYDTGIEYVAGDDSSIVELKSRAYNLEVMSNYFEEMTEYFEDMDEYLEAKIDGEENSLLPQYWITCLESLHDKIDTLQMENGADTFQFLWCSDIHGVTGTSPSNTTYIGEIGRYMMDKYNIPFFIATGDIMSQASHTNTTNIWAEYDKLNTMLSPIENEEFLAIRGNHDGVWGSPTTYNGQANQYYHSFIGHKALFNAFMRRQTLDSYRRVFGHDGSYFYVDYHNYRIYMLNTHTFGDDSANDQGQAVYNGFRHQVIGSKQMQWVADTLNTVKDNQEVIFMAHAPLNQQLDHTVFRSMLNYYLSRGKGTATVGITGTWWGTDSEYANTTINVDFTNAKGTILGWFNGHIHNDTVNTSAYSMLPMFSITTAGGDVRDSYYTNGTLTRVKGTATETAIDLVTITSDYIYFTRIGSGYDRVYNRATKEVTIDTNSAYVPPSDGGDTGGGSTSVKPIKPIKPNVTIEPEDTPAVGEDITTAVGYTNGVRLSTSSGNESNLSGSVATGFIEIIPGDVIRIKGLTFPSSLDSYHACCQYDDDKSYLSKYQYLHTGTVGSGQVILVGVTFTISGDLITLTVDDDISTIGCRYIRVAGTCADGANLKITRNMELE